MSKKAKKSGAQRRSQPTTRGKRRIASNGSGKPLVPQSRRKQKPARPRSQVLPGMEQVRSAKLDNVCEGLAETRSEMAITRENEASWIRQALKVMHEEGIKGSYKHGGIELTLVPGGDKLRIHLLKEQEETATYEDKVVVTEAAQAPPQALSDDNPPF